MAVLSAQLREVTVQDYAQSQFAKMAPDFGINVSGKFTDVSENGTAFIGVDNGAAGRKFTEVAANAAQEAKK